MLSPYQSGSDNRAAYQSGSDNRAAYQSGSDNRAAFGNSSHLPEALNYHRSVLDPQSPFAANEYPTLDALDHLRLRGYNGSGAQHRSAPSAAPFQQLRQQGGVVGGGAHHRQAGFSVGQYIPSRLRYDNVMSAPTSLSALEALGGGVRASTFALRRVGVTYRRVAVTPLHIYNGSIAVLFAVTVWERSNPLLPNLKTQTWHVKVCCYTTGGTSRHELRGDKAGVPSCGKQF
jgi:hypothetical protein